jgi:hypothetical protein
MTRSFFCATAARRRDDPMVGTAAPARSWLLVEYAAAWSTHALDSGELRGRVGRALDEAARSVGGRTLLVRRPGRRRVQPLQWWWVLDHTGARQRGQWRVPDDLLEPAQLLRGGLTTTGSEGSAGEPVLLVCTHGLHDTCCAVRGRPVARALAARWPEQTWECSHVGGDRFAPSVLVLPDGTCYGRLDEDSAVPVVQAHLDGVVSVDHLRGSSLAPAPAQAAMVEAQRRYGPAGPRDVLVRSCEQVGANTFEVRLDGLGPLPDLSARVRRLRQAPAQLTCRATTDSSAFTYAVESLTVV